MSAKPDTGRRPDHGQPGRTRLRAAERRETILRAATEVFAEAGYQAGKVSDVAARVGVTEPVIFQNFGSKAGLFAAVIQRAAVDVRASLDDLVAESASASDLLAHVLRATDLTKPGRSAGHPASPHPNLRHFGAAYGVLFADAAALSARPEVTEAARIAIDAVATHLADLIRHAQARGAIAADVNPEAAAWFFLSVISTRRLRSGAMPSRLEPDVLALTLRALAPRAVGATEVSI